MKEFLGYHLSQDEVAVFDRLRRKRHMATYDVSSIFTHTDAESAIAMAIALVDTIKGILTEDGFLS